MKPTSEQNVPADIAAAVLADIAKYHGVESPKLTDYIDEDDDEGIIGPLLKQWNVEFPPRAEVMSYGKQHVPDGKWTVADMIAFMEWCVDYNEKHPTYRDEVRARNAAWRVRGPRILKKTFLGIYLLGVLGFIVWAGLCNFPGICISILVFLVLSGVGLYLYHRKHT